MSSAMNKESGRVQADLAFNFPGAPLSVFEGGVFSSILKCEHLSLRTRRHVPNLPNRFGVSSWRMNKRQFLQITRALVDSRRFDILERIASAQGEISCVSLRAKLPISRATLSHHLKELATAGLIETRRESRYMFLRMRRKTWSRYMKRLGRIAP
jgi:ArsR family transcriptional regulator